MAGRPAANDDLRRRKAEGIFASLTRRRPGEAPDTLTRPPAAAATAPPALSNTDHPLPDGSSLPARHPPFLARLDVRTSSPPLDDLTEHPARPLLPRPSAVSHNPSLRHFKQRRRP